MRNALRRSQPVEAAAEIAKVLGLPANQTVNEVELSDTVTHLRYRGFKPAELAMLAADCKP
ncbi:MAG TPA: hypothetical protein DCQ06_10435, partial [Myxococcales bacterium]|nr:hypothetical protein [Myxococcales bacterium]